MVEEIQLLNPDNGQIKAVKYTKGMQFVAPWIPIQIRQLTGATAVSYTHLTLPTILRV